MFTLQPLQRYQLKQRLVEDVMQHQAIEPALYLNSGELAEQQLGELQLEQQSAAVAELLEPVLQHPHYSGLQRFSAELDIGHTLSASIESYSEQGLLLPSLSSLKGKVLIEFWLKHCLLCATRQIEFSELVHRDGNKVESLRLKILPPREAQEILQDLLQGYVEGQQRILPFYPDTALEYEKKRRELNAEIARQHIHKLWYVESFHAFFEARDAYLQTSLKNAELDEAGFPAEMYALSSRFLQPLLEAIDAE